MELYFLTIHKCGEFNDSAESLIGNLGLYISYGETALKIDNQGSLIETHYGFAMSESEANNLFTFTENGTEEGLTELKVSSYIGNETNIRVPRVIYDDNGDSKYMILSIGENAFAVNHEIKKVAIFCILDSANQSAIATNAFNNQTSITDLYFPIYKSTEESLTKFTGYDTKWGATNATIHIGESNYNGMEEEIN